MSPAFGQNQLVLFPGSESVRDQALRALEERFDAAEAREILGRAVETTEAGPSCASMREAILWLAASGLSTSSSLAELTLSHWELPEWARNGALGARDRTHPPSAARLLRAVSPSA